MIIVTAIAHKETKETADKLGISGYFTKPLEISELIKNIEKVFVE